jgi:hypothetical protein
LSNHLSYFQTRRELQFMGRLCKKLSFVKDEKFAMSL